MENTIKEESAVKSITSATTFSFSICVLCWSVFWLLPNWWGTGIVASLEVVNAVWVSFGICLTMSIWGYLCFAGKIAKNASVLVRYLIFGVIGYFIIAAWVFGSGWCPLEGLGLFTIICIVAIFFACFGTYIGNKKSDERLNKQLQSYKQS